MALANWCRLLLRYRFDFFVVGWLISLSFQHSLLPPSWNHVRINACDLTIKQSFFFLWKFWIRFILRCEWKEKVFKEKVWLFDTQGFPTARNERAREIVKTKIFHHIYNAAVACLKGWRFSTEACWQPERIFNNFLPSTFSSFSLPFGKLNLVSF